MTNDQSVLMIQRLLQSATMLATTFVAYQAYVLLAVPWLEPPLAMRESKPLGADAVEIAGSSVTRYQRLLAAYFSADHWSLAHPPKVVENDTGSVMFVLDDYKRHEDGRVELSHFALLIFPTPRQSSVIPPRDAIVLEAPQGAELQFDKTFRPERGQIGQIVRGKFPGRITIHSDMKAEGPDDDLWIETHDLEMNSKLLFTKNDVRFRLGPNIGGGREMEIRLLEDDGAKSRRSGLKIAGVDSLEILRDVRLRVFVAAQSLLADEGKTEKPSPLGRGQGEGALANGGAPSPRPSPEGRESITAALADPSQPPVDVTCTGPFHFDFIRYVASFDENVEAWQVNPNGPSDQLSCDRLDFHFARKLDAEEPSARIAFDPAKRQRDDMRWLEPDQIVAEGYPVVIVSPSRSAEVRGGRVQIMLRQRRLAISGGDDVLVAYGPNQLRAPTIHYQHPPTDAGTKIGTFRADGPGSLRYVADPAKPDQVFNASWQASVQLNRYNGQPVLTLAGRPQLSAAGGCLSADQIRVYLRELDSPGKPAVDAPGTLSLNGAGGAKIEILPDRMNAVGQVEIDSPELLARTRELIAEFHVEPAPEGADATSSPWSPQQPGGGPSNLLGSTLSGSSGSPERTYQVISDSMQLDVAMRGKRAVPKTLTCNGNVAFRELPSAANDGQPMEVRGGQLTAENLDTSAHITIRGTEKGDAALFQPAEILARGMTFRAADVQLDQAQNRLWSDGPGTATVWMNGGLAAANPLVGAAAPGAVPTPVEVRWQGGVAFDGRNIVFQRRVEVEAPDDWLRCDELAGKLSAPLNFGQRVDQNAIELAEIECRGNVEMDHKSRDATGLTTHERIELARITINQLNGAISGDGPGVIRSTHFAEQVSGLMNPVPIANPTTAPTTKLQFLRVDFQEGLVGNLHTKEIEFRRRVRTVYGPVDAWEQELSIDRPESLPPETITLTSNTLRINENPLAARAQGAGGTQLAGRSFGPVQMIAETNVRINGQSPGQGEFTATADRAAYDQAKEQFLLEGSDRSPATLYHQKSIGGQFAKNAARKIQYSRLTGQIEQDGVHLFEFTPGAPADPQNALGPVPLRQ